MVVDGGRCRGKEFAHDFFPLNCVGLNKGLSRLQIEC